MKGRFKHGLKGTPLYNVWKTMRQRCYNKNDKNYKHYGARGIQICISWYNNYLSFYNWAIFNGYEKGLSIERINVDGNYCPENCKWINIGNQSKNRTDTLKITIDGITHCAMEWSKITGISRGTIRKRFLNGYKGKDIISTKNFSSNNKNIKIKKRL